MIAYNIPKLTVADGRENASNPVIQCFFFHSQVKKNSVIQSEDSEDYWKSSLLLGVKKKPILRQGRLPEVFLVVGLDFFSFFIYVYHIQLIYLKLNQSKLRMSPQYVILKKINSPIEKWQFALDFPKLTQKSFPHAWQHAINLGKSIKIT